MVSFALSVFLLALAVAAILGSILLYVVIRERIERPYEEDRLPPDVALHSTDANGYVHTSPPFDLHSFMEEYDGRESDTG